MSNFEKSIPNNELNGVYNEEKNEIKNEIKNELWFYTCQLECDIYSEKSQEFTLWMTTILDSLIKKEKTV